jgi:hypothetical protein
MTGSVALRAIIDDPALDLIAVKVSSPTKIGTDAGRLCGRPDVGIAATATWLRSGRQAGLRRLLRDSRQT